MAGTAQVRLCPPYGRAMTATFVTLLRAADELDPRLGFFRQAAIGGEIVERHAARGEAGEWSSARRRAGKGASNGWRMAARSSATRRSTTATALVSSSTTKPVR